jgi:hypothetical protein
VSESFLDEWHRIVAEQDLDALMAILAEDASIGAPPYWAKLEGRPLVHHLLGLILETIEGFRYYREWQQEGELALEFKGRVGDLEVQGIDLISLDATGCVANIDVLMRPTNAVLRLQEIIGPKMVDFLSRTGTSS